MVLLLLFVLLCQELVLTLRLFLNSATRILVHVPLALESLVKALVRLWCLLSVLFNILDFVQVAVEIIGQILTSFEFGRLSYNILYH